MIVMNNKRIALISLTDNSNALAFASQQEQESFLENGNRIIRPVPSKIQFEHKDIECVPSDDKTEIALVNEIIGEIDTNLFDIAISCDCFPHVDTMNALQKVLQTFEKHAAVSPRFNSGEFCSFPGFQYNSNRDKTILTATNYLADFSRIPCASGNLVLLQGEVIDNLGFLDIAFETLAGAIWDFCLRINVFGFDSLIANHAFEEAKLIEPSKNDLSTLSNRYGYFHKMTEYYNQYGIDGCCRFFDLMVPGEYEKPKILFEFSSMLPFHCGTTEYQMAMLKYFFEFYAERYDLTIFVNREADDFFHLNDHFGHCVFSEDELGTYHLGFFAAQPVKIENQFILNKHCLKIVYTMLDAIMLRCHYILQADAWKGEDIIRLGLDNCDGIIAISDFSRHDYKDYYAASSEIKAKSSLCVHIATDFGMNTTENTLGESLPFEHYTLIVGNSFRHKALHETLEAVAGTNRNYIVVGWDEKGLIHPNVYAYPTTKLPEAFLDSLYEHCDNFVFPSLYEGFGLPIVIAIKHGKRVIVNDNELNHELFNAYPELQEFFTFYQKFSQIPKFAEATAALPPLPNDIYHYSWRDTIIDIEAYLHELLQQPTEPSALERRWRTMNLMQNQMKEASESVGLRIALRRRFLSGHSEK